MTPLYKKFNAKKYSTKQQKKDCRKKNKLSYDSLIKFTKKT